MMKIQKSKRTQKWMNEISLRRTSYIKSMYSSAVCNLFHSLVNGILEPILNQAKVLYKCLVLFFHENIELFAKSITIAGL